MTPKSWLFTPGGRPDRVAKALASDAGAVILDLEDSIAHADKPQARNHVVAALKSWSGASPSLGVRINPQCTEAHQADLDALLPMTPRPAFLLVPKVEDAAAISSLVDQAAGLRIIALIETAKGVLKIGDIAAVAGLGGLMFGAADYAADLGGPGGDHPHAYARAAIGNAAAAYGMIAIDSPAFAVDDENGLIHDCQTARAMGFHAKAVIHPRQIAPVNAAFDWSDEDRVQAARILASLDGVGVLDGRMIDEAMARWARRVLA